MTENMTSDDENVTRVALISPDPSFRSLATSGLTESSHPIEWSLRAESEVATLGKENVDRLVELEVGLVFVDIGRDLVSGTRFISALTSAAPETVVVAAGEAFGAQELLRVIRAGASEYVARPFDRDEIAEACTRILRRTVPRKAAGQKPRAGNLVALFSPKGGTGVSTTASNLAVHIGKATGNKTLLLDLAPSLGTCSVILGVEPRYSYLDVVESLSRMDERLLHSFLEKHESGIWILGSPIESTSAADFGETRVTSLLRLLRGHFDYVIADVGRANVEPITLRTLEVAEHRLCLTTPDLPTLRNVKQVMPHLPGGQGTPNRSIRLIVNRYEEGRSMPKKDVERAVGLPVYQVLGEDRARVDRSVNLGKPIVLNGSSPYSVGVKKVGEKIASKDIEKSSSDSGIMGFLRVLLPPYGGNGKSRKDDGSRNKGLSRAREEVE